MRQEKRHITYDSTNQLVSAANAQTYALSVTYGDWGKIQQYGLSQTDLASNTTTSQTRFYSYGSLNEGQTAFAPNNISYADGTNVNEQYGINGSLQRREINIPGNPPEIEHYRFTTNGNLQAYMYENLLYVHYGYNDANTRTYKYSFNLTPNWVNGRLESVNFFCPFFCLETKETKVQGCEKKAKKRLRSAKVVKLAQQNEFAAKHIYHKLSQSPRPQKVLCSNSDDFLTLSPYSPLSYRNIHWMFLHIHALFFNAFGCHTWDLLRFFSTKRFLQKIDARWAEQLPGKRGLVGWIGINCS